MKIKTVPDEITRENYKKQDRLGRHEHVEILTDFISTLTEHSFVIAIDSRWGTGKTTFVQLWEKYLQAENYQCLYYNAWENDYSEDPFVSMFCEINSLIANPDNKTKLINAAKKCGSFILKNVVPRVINVATSGWIDKELVSNLISDVTEKSVGEAIDKYEEYKKTVKEFKDALGEYVASQGAGKPIVFFIDELDRCRPTFAIELLERAKHIFDVPGIIFVLALDKKQLGYSIKTCYGSEADVDGYLRRFFDYEYNLPKPSNSQFIQFLFEKQGINEFMKRKSGCNTMDIDSTIEMLDKLTSIFSMSLRDIEKAVSSIAIALRTISGKPLYYEFLFSLVVLRLKEKELYLKLVNGQINGADFKKAVKNKYDFNCLTGNNSWAFCEILFSVSTMSTAQYESYFQELRQPFQAIRSKIACHIWENKPYERCPLQNYTAKIELTERLHKLD